jgi:hypothetical protein
VLGAARIGKIVEIRLRLRRRTSRIHLAMKN